ncbi:zf-HC2 domain-containing protein [Streptomyces sp. SCSIO 30461]|uniref:zf-HC2 domain-containing protein n=1 Tax=Streptomyces sp. SCSIO 30461 TaxID=3118085 RepID=UPI0030CAE2AF
MDLRERHRDVAAYALGVLGPSDAFRFEEHLSECVLCAVRLTDFAPVASTLAELGVPGASEPPVTRPSAALLDRLLGTVEQDRRRGSRRRLRLVAAAAALIVALPVVVVGLVGDGAGTEDTVPRLVATDAATGVYGAIDLHRKKWGTAVALRLAKVTGPRTCELVVVGKDGAEHPVSTWSVPRDGYGLPGAAGTGKPLDIEVATALTPDEIGHVEIRTESGERLVSLDR